MQATTTALAPAPALEVLQGRPPDPKPELGEPETPVSQMTPRQLRVRLRAELDALTDALIEGETCSAGLHIEIRQRKPNTFFGCFLYPVWAEDWPETRALFVVASYQIRIVEGIGFSKVCYPDVWNAEYGIERARNRAVTDLINALLPK